MEIKEAHKNIEEQAIKVLQDLGYSVKRKKFFGGPDILATRKGVKVAVNCKVMSPTIADVAEVRKFHIDHAFIYTKSRPTPSSVAFATQQEVIIGGPNELEKCADKWIQQAKVGLLELLYSIPRMTGPINWIMSVVRRIFLSK